MACIVYKALLLLCMNKYLQGSDKKKSAVSASQQSIIDNSGLSPGVRLLWKPPFCLSYGNENSTKLWPKKSAFHCSSWMRRRHRTCKFNGSGSFTSLKKRYDSRGDGYKHKEATRNRWQDRIQLDTVDLLKRNNCSLQGILHPFGKYRLE